MNLKSKFAIDIIAVSIICLTWFFTKIFILGLFIYGLYLIILRVFKDTKKTSIILKSKLALEEVVVIILIMLVSVIFGILLYQLAKAGILSKLLGNLWFTGILWLTGLSSIMLSYLKEKKKYVIEMGTNENGEA